VGEVRNSVAAFIEVFLKDVLRLEGKSEVNVGVRVHLYISEYERTFRDGQLEGRNKDLAAKVCRALCRRRVFKEMVQQASTPTEAHWLGMDIGYDTAHLEIESIAPERAHLPITETGYRSHFTSPDSVAAYGGPVAFVEAWLETESQAPDWRREEQQRRQLSLF
jgi:hypothetical protein